MSPRRVLAEHSSRELTEWRAFDRAFGLSYAGDMQSGTISASVWNSSGGIPEGNSKRAAKVGDFFPSLALPDDEDEETGGPRRVSHDEPDPEDYVDDDVMTDAERATQAMKNAWAAWGLQQNAALRAAEQLDAGEPPEAPEMN